MSDDTAATVDWWDINARRRNDDGGDVVHASGCRLQDRERHNVCRSQYDTSGCHDGAGCEIGYANGVTVWIGNERVCVNEIITSSIFQVEGVVYNRIADVIAYDRVGFE